MNSYQQLTINNDTQLLCHFTKTIGPIFSFIMGFCILEYREDMKRGHPRV